MARHSLLGVLAAAALVAACSDGPTESGSATTPAPATPVATSTTPDTSVAPETTDPAETAASTETVAAPETADAPPTTAAPGYPDQPPGVPFPTVEWPVGELPAGVNQAVIDAAVDRAFGAPDAEARVRSIVVVSGGQIVYERYHPLDGPNVIYSSFSVAKSFTSALIGMLVADGQLALDENPPQPEWQAPGDPRQAITLRHLLQMSSGLQWTEEYGLESLAVQMLTSDDAAALMAAQPLESPPGSTFEYSTGTTVLLAGIAADALGGCAAAKDYLTTRLLQPIGITTAQLVSDGGGCWFGGFGADMTTRDFARFGLLYLRGGEWDGRQIVPTAWVDESRVPAATEPGYGLQWWLRADGLVFSAEGLFGQRIVIVPGSDLVIATNSTNGGEPSRMTDIVLTAFGVPSAPGP